MDDDCAACCMLVFVFMAEPHHDAFLQYSSSTLGRIASAYLLGCIAVIELRVCSGNFGVDYSPSIACFKKHISVLSAVHGTNRRRNRRCSLSDGGGHQAQRDSVQGFHSDTMDEGSDFNTLRVISTVDVASTSRSSTHALLLSTWHSREAVTAHAKPVLIASGDLDGARLILVLSADGSVEAAEQR